MVISVGCCLILWNETFIELWVKGDAFYLGDTATVMIVLVVIQMVLLRNDAFVIDLTLNR